MPLLNGEPFIKQQPPADLQPEEEVFFSPITYEVFRDYDDFFDRTIQLNSMVWGCSFCGMRNLNYREAVSCEEGDRSRLEGFGPGLCRGLLYIMLRARRRRLADLVDVLLAFSASRYFVGEILCLRRTDADNSFERTVVVERVIVPQRVKTEDSDNEIRPSMPDAKLIKYVVRASTETTDATSNLILPFSALQRPPHNFLNRDRIKSFIRQTGKLECQLFVPREFIMKHFDVYPYGGLKWADIFADPDLQWSEIVLPRVITGREKLVMTSGDSPNISMKKTSDGPVQIKTIGVSVNNHSSTDTIPTDIHRLSRIERTELERTWSLLRKRDDLDLSDLVPLPPLTPLRLRRFIPPDDFGTCLRVYEFINVYGGFLQLPVPGTSQLLVRGEVGRSPVVMEEDREESRLTWTALEEILFSQDPLGPFADVLFGLLCAIRRLEVETNGRQLPPTAEAAAASTVSAIATLEAGLPLASAATLTGLGCSQEYTTMLTDSLTASTPSGSALTSIFYATAEATRQCELVGLAPAHSALASKAERAAASIAVGSNIIGDSGAAAAGGRSMAVRASALAVALGAVSLPPLDRAGLAEALWLHLNTAPAKTGGWRGSIWGGTRPLDDPCVDFLRTNREIVDKLRSVPLYSWPLSDRLSLLACLMDELLLQPQMRERMEYSSEQLRKFRLDLRTVQSDRYKYYGGNANIANMLYGFSPSTLISTSDSWLTGTPPILRNTMNKPRKKTIEAAKAKLALEFNQARAAATGKPIPLDLESGGQLQLPPIGVISVELEKEEHKLWESVLYEARRFSLIPLGQDRIYRRYWLLPSLPALLVEDTTQEAHTAPPIPAASPGKLEEGSSQPTLRVRGRQVDAGVALGASAREAAYNLHQAAEQMCANAEAEDEHWQNPRLLDRDSLLSQLAIDLPANRENLSLEQLKALVHPSRRNNPRVDSNHPAVIQVEELQRKASRWSLLLPLPPSAGEESTSGGPESRYAGARRAVAQLEASLNPRGTRESHLRKAVCQLRPILIRAVAECPVDVLAVPEEVKMMSTEDAKEELIKDPGTVLLAWLETAVRGVALRLGVPFARLEEATKSMKLEEEKEEAEKGGDENNSPVGGSGENLDDESQQKRKFQQLVQMILALANIIGPRRLAAPLSSDDRSLRGVLPSISNFASMDDASTPSPPPTPSTPQPSSTPSLIDTSMAGKTRGGGTTGFQRWCRCVQSATTTAQLHLLLRALERSVRKANRGGRGVPAAIGSYATRFRLPEIRCTACRGPPDSASGSGDNSVLPFSLCGGCACPFHQDCLLNSLSRQSGSITTTSTSYRGTRSTLASAASIGASISCLYSLMPHHINTTAAARQDILKAALLLCQRCRRLAGNLSAHDGVIEEEHFIEPLSDELLETVQLKEGMVGEEGGSDEAVYENGEEDGVGMGYRDFNEENIDENVSATPTLTHSKATSNGRVPMARRGRGRRSRGSFSMRTSNSTHSSHRGRSAKRPRYLQDYEADGAEGEDGPNNYNYFGEERKNKADPVYPIVATHGNDDGEEILYEDEMEDYEDLKPKQRPKRGGLSNRVNRIATDITKSSRKRGRSTANLATISRNSVTIKSSVETAEAESGNSEENDGTVRSQVEAERLLAEISSLSAARPLLRCALSKTVLSEGSAEQDLLPSEQRRRSSMRSRRPTPFSDGSSPTKSPGGSGLLAYDLESLKDLVVQGSLPGGPSQVVSQLRLLTQHWTSINRPGSRLHGCAVEIAAFLEKRLRNFVE